jgi:hypothetical protein
MSQAESGDMKRYSQDNAAEWVMWAALLPLLTWLLPSWEPGWAQRAAESWPVFESRSAGDNAGDIVVRATGVEPGDWSIGSVLPWFWIAGSVLLCAAFSAQALRLRRLTATGGTAPARHRAIASNVADSLSLPAPSLIIQRSRPHSAGLGRTASAHPASRRLARLA